MINDIIKGYDEIDEEHRLQSTLARKVEFITTIEALGKYYNEKMKILDVGCGSGIYSLYFAERGAHVVSIDLVPKHIEQLRQSAFKRGISLDCYVKNAVNMKEFRNDFFDIVLCLGPLYHLIDFKDSLKCIDECIRVVKHGGIIAFSYISPYSVFPYVIRGDKSRISSELIDKILDKKKITSDDECCFWTEMKYYLPDEIVSCMKRKGLIIEDHLTPDGQSIAFQSVINTMTVDEFELWMEYHRKICRIKSIIETSNHGLLISRKKR